MDEHLNKKISKHQSWTVLLGGQQDVDFFLLTIDVFRIEKLALSRRNALLIQRLKIAVKQCYYAIYSENCTAFNYNEKQRNPNWK